MQNYPWLTYSQNKAQQQACRIITEQAEYGLTWQELGQHIQSLVEQFRAYQLTQHQAIAFCGSNCIEVVIFYLAAIQAGIPVLGINPHFPDHKIEQICQENAIQAYYAPDKNLFTSALSSKTFPKPTALSLDFQLSHTFLPLQQYGDFIHPATLTLTSGSSGQPKAVVHHVKAHLENAKGVCQLMSFQSQHSWLLSLPLFHVSGQGIIWRWLEEGATLVLCDRTHFYSALTSVTHASLVPTQGWRLLDFISQERPVSLQLRHILLGGATIPLALSQAFREYDISTYYGYGMTEMASTIFAKLADGKLGVGYPLKGREYRIVNQEVQLKGAGLALGYWQGNVQHIVPLVNSQGWFATKDRGEIQQGELILRGRLDNMFISGGENIQAEEIEAILNKHDNVVQSMVFPVEDKEFGQRPVALIQFKQGEFAEQSVLLRDWLVGKLEKFKQPVAYFSLPVEVGLPLGSIKLSRSQLKRWLEQQNLELAIPPKNKAQSS